MKKSNLTIDMEWERITPTGNTMFLNYDFVLETANLDVNYYATFVDTDNPYSDFIGSTVVCTVTSPDLPGEVNTCSFGPFMGPTTTPMPSTKQTSTNMYSTQTTNVLLSDKTTTGQEPTTTKESDKVTIKRVPTTNPKGTMTSYSISMVTTGVPGKFLFEKAQKVNLNLYRKKQHWLELV